MSDKKDIKYNYLLIGSVISAIGTAYALYYYIRQSETQTEIDSTENEEKKKTHPDVQVCNVGYNTGTLKKIQTTEKIQKKNIIKTIVLIRSPVNKSTYEPEPEQTEPEQTEPEPEQTEPEPEPDSDSGDEVLNNDETNAILMMV